MKYLILLLFFTTGPLFSNTSPTATATSSISGIVMDEEFKEPIPYASISIKNSQNEVVAGTVSAADGSFKIEKLEKGNYTLNFQFMGYKTLSKEVTILNSNEEVKIGPVYLETDVSQLKDVEVVAERSTIEQRIDRKVINVGKDLTTLGPSASDIMGNLPTLTVDQDGNIAMRGNPNVRILLDGEPTNIPASQLLKQIPSTSIKSIELITNPSAKYNPEGMSGIINIILNKNSNLGFNANVAAGVTVGENTRYNSSVNMNYRTGKLNFFGNLGANWGRRSQFGKIQDFTNNSTEIISFNGENEVYLYKVGVDFYLNEKNTFSGYFTQNYFTGGPAGSVDIIFEDKPGFNIYQDFLVDVTSWSNTYNLIYKKAFDKEGHSLELETNYNSVNSDQLADFNYEGTSSLENYSEDLNDDIENFTTNIDYVNPLNKTAKIEMGAEGRIRTSKNTYQTSNVNLQDAVYNYDNKIFSFYTTFGQDFTKWSYQLGTRLESYGVEAILDGAQVYEDDYFTAYPTVFFSYKFSEINSLQLSYGRRVDRPTLKQVNPVREFSTPRITSLGNPQLDPQFTNSVEFNYNHNFKKGNLTAGIFYREIKNEINQVIILDPEDSSRLLLTYINGEDNWSYGVEFSGNYRPFKWWNISPSLELYNKNERGIVGTNLVEAENRMINFRVNQSFNVSKKLTLQTFGYYQGPSTMLQLQSEEMYFVNAGARYNLLNDRATLSVNFNDIFDTQEFIFTTEFPYEQRGAFKPDSQTVNIAFSYRFGGGKNRALARKNRDKNEVEGGGIF